MMGVAKFTAAAQELKQWCLDQHDKYVTAKKEGRKDTSFGNEGKNEAERSEVEELMEEPSDNTKMIT